MITNDHTHTPTNQLHRDELHTTRQKLSNEHSVLDRPLPPTEKIIHALA